MKKVFVILACLPEQGTPSAMNAQKVQYIGEYPTKDDAEEQLRELLAIGNANPYVYWIEKAWAREADIPRLIDEWEPALAVQLAWAKLPRAGRDGGMLIEEARTLADAALLARRAAASGETPT